MFDDYDYDYDRLVSDSEDLLDDDYYSNDCNYSNECTEQEYSDYYFNLTQDMD